ncbi:MAG: GNAT family N-acetyltransferase [Myxococcales bacterium]|nr:GNAT family N-acetyltransferase [Myxococcales bacterium]
MSLGVRTATLDDLDFVLQVQKRAMSPATIAQYGAWSDELQRQNTNPHTIGTYEILSWHGEDVGAQQITTHADHLEFRRLYVAPEHQGRGIGTAVAHRIFAIADRLGLPIRIRVFQTNVRARAGYERVGFVVTAQTDTHVFLQRDAR